MFQLVIDRTYDGYMTEIHTVYGQLQGLLGVKIEAAPDEWDRLFNVDFFIKVGENYIGLQIKPAGGVAHIPEIFKELKQQSATHRKFTDPPLVQTTWKFFCDFHRKIQNPCFL